MSSATIETGTIETNIPGRLDRLPWSRFHWLIILGLGTVWILDGLEVTMVGAVASRLTEKGSGIHMDAGQIGTAAAIYVAGSCCGALFFGQLTDRFGRKKLFMLTLLVYILFTSLTAFSFAPWFFYLCRFFTGAGIGGEYAAINSAIDELIPARVRGRVDLTINGSYWVGSAAGSAAALFFLDEAIFAGNVGWRLAFGVGAVFGLTIMIVRRHVPESPRWLFIHGREEEGEAIVDSIENDIEEETHQPLESVDKTITVRQRTTIPFREIAKVAWKAYPKRSMLCFALFVGQAFLYNGVTFNLGTLYTGFFGISSGAVPIFTIIYAVGNFAGPMLLGRLFDTVGRKPMISGTYFGSAAIATVMAILFAGDVLGKWSFVAFIFATFFLASAGASAAYLTVSEIFPMETRALAIALFYAIGTAVGGITGPLLFGHLISSGSRGQVSIAFFIGAAVMALGGLAEILWGVRAERAQLEDIAKPLTAEEAEHGALNPEEGGEEPAEAAAQQGEAADEDTRPEHRAALESRAEAEEARARAAEHRAAIHELQARAADGDERARERAEVEAALAEIADLRAGALDERAAAHDERADSEELEGAERDAALERARAAEERSAGYEERARALSAERDAEAERHQALAEAAGERARAREHRAEAEKARGDADGADEAAAELARARAEMHERWAGMHEARGRAFVARADGDEAAAAEEDRTATATQELALAAEQLVQAAEHRVQASEVAGARAAAEDVERRRSEAAERERRAHEFEERVRMRMDRRRARDTGLRRFRPGPPGAVAAPWMVSSPMEPDAADLDREIEVIARALDEHGATERRELARLVGARYWGPGRFGSALREAVEEGRASRLSRSTFGPPERS